MSFNKYTIPEKDVLEELDGKLEDDLSFSSGRILGSMCSKPHPLAELVFNRYIEKNIGDPGLFPSSAVLESETIDILGNMFSCRDARGTILTGGTEANLLAMWTAKKRCINGEREVIIPESAHFSFDKAASMMDLKLIKIPLTSSRQINTVKAAEAVSARTMAIVGVAGSTGLGVVDPIEQLSTIALKNNIYLHIDAAFGGFVLPFLKEIGCPAPGFDFIYPGVCSITVDPHKMGRAPIPAGCLIYRNKEIADFSKTNVTYLSGGETNHRTIVGTRSGAAAAAVWAVLKHLGKEGYNEIVRKAMKTTNYLATELKKINGISIVTEPVMNVIGFKHKTISENNLALDLRRKGWAVAQFPDFLRIVLMPHITEDSLIPFLRDLKEVIHE